MKLGKELKNIKCGLNVDIIIIKMYAHMHIKQ